MARVVARLVHFGGIWTDEAVAHFRLVAALDQVGPDADALLVVVGEAWRALVLGGLAVPAGVEDATVGVVREEAVEAGAVGRRYGRLCGCLERSETEGESCRVRCWTLVVCAQMRPRGQSLSGSLRSDAQATGAMQI